MAAKAVRPATKAVAAKTTAAVDAAEAQRDDQVEAASTTEAEAAAAADGGDQHDNQVGADTTTTEAIATAVVDGGEATAAVDGDPATAPPAAAVVDAAQVRPVPLATASDLESHLYRVLSNLEHDLVLYAPGSLLQLSDDQAAPLLGHTVTPHADQDTDETAG